MINEYSEWTIKELSKKYKLDCFDAWIQLFHNKIFMKNILYLKGYF